MGQDGYIVLQYCMCVSICINACVAFLCVCLCVLCLFLCMSVCISMYVCLYVHLCVWHVYCLYIMCVCVLWFEFASMLFYICTSVVYLSVSLVLHTCIYTNFNIHAPVHVCDLCILVSVCACAIVSISMSFCVPISVCIFMVICLSI